MPGGSCVKNLPASAGDSDLIHRSGRSPGGGGRGNPLQYSSLENPMDRGAWRAAAHGVAKNPTRLSVHKHTFPCVCITSYGNRQALCTRRLQVKGENPLSGSVGNNPVCGRRKRALRHPGSSWFLRADRRRLPSEPSPGASSSEKVLRGVCRTARPGRVVTVCSGGRRAGAQTRGSCSSRHVCPLVLGRGPAQGALIRASCSLLCPHGGGPPGARRAGWAEQLPHLLRGTPTLSDEAPLGLGHLKGLPGTPSPSLLGDGL